MKLRNLSFLLLLCSCTTAVYENDSYSLYADKVVQGEYTGVAETPYKIVSNLNGEEYVWEKKNDISAFPELITSYPVEEAVYNMSIDECINAVEPDGTLRTGLEWGGVWTRDVSYSTIHLKGFLCHRIYLLKPLLASGNLVYLPSRADPDLTVGTAWPCSARTCILYNLTL